MSDHFFQVSNLAVHYGSTAVVKNISFTLAQGEIGCLLGESGCGKTTALRAIAGLEPVANGEIHLQNRLLSAKKHSLAPAKRGMGMVFQDYALFTHLTAADNVGFGLHQLSATAKKQRVADMLALVGLSDHAHARPENLSGGQQQRVALARALAPAPKLLLLDEPFSNLDIHLRENLATSVRDILKTTNTTAILVTHDQHEAFAMADKIGVIQQGTLAQWAAPETIYHEPVSQSLANFIGEGVFVAGTVVGNHVKTAIGALNLNRLVQPATQKLENGTQVKVLVRPDDIRHNDASMQTATVLKKVFRGSNYLYTLVLSSDEQVLSLVPSHHNHAVGDSIGITPVLEHLVLFS